MSPVNHPQRLGPYVIDRQIGRGGMGTVYSAVEEGTGRHAAIKVIAHTLAMDESFRERFAAEIESLKKLRHPNIVELIGYGEQDGYLFYVMELIRGESLQDELKHGRRFDWREVTRIAIAICAALKHAHDHGIIHRDLKPANLLLTADDQVKLFDFGIAKLFGSTSVTTGSVMGTADYMAPEQGEGKPVGPRSDLYSLGSVMYALLAGRPPFVGKSIPEVVHKVRFEKPVPVGRVAHDVPVELEHLIEQLLEKDPAKRVPTALAVSHRLKAMEHALSVERRDEDLVHEGDTPVARKERSVPSADVADTPTVQLTNQHRTDLRADTIEITTDNKAATTHDESHFVRVSDHERKPIDWPTVAGTAFKLIMTALLLVAIVAGVWYVRQPPDADSLFQRITEANVRSGNDLISTERDIQTFRKYYSDDERMSRVDQVAEQLAVERLERQMVRKAERGLSGTSVIEQLYLDAISSAHSTAETTEKLQAILSLYRDDASLSAEENRCLILAERELLRIEEQERREAEQHLPALTRQLDEARQLESTDPARAAQIYQAALRLYQHRTWAQPLCDAAQLGLQRLNADAETNSDD